MTKYKPGDVVQLKSGGIQMTVKEVRGTESGEMVCCIWTEYGQMWDGIRPQSIEERGFPIDVLRKVDKAE